MFPEVTRDRALRCAKGTKQLELVVEMLNTGKIEVSLLRVPYQYGGLTVPAYGTVQLPFASFKPLQNRLKEEGFVFIPERGAHRNLERLVVAAWDVLD